MPLPTSEVRVFVITRMISFVYNGFRQTLASRAGDREECLHRKRLEIDPTCVVLVHLKLAMSEHAGMPWENVVMRHALSTMLPKDEEIRSIRLSRESYKTRKPIFFRLFMDG